MLDVQIQKVTLQDLPTLQHIARSTFIEAFSADNTPQNMAIYVANAFNLEQLQSELTNPLSQFFFALHKTEVIGYIKVNRGAAQTEEVAGHCIELERIYVQGHYHGKGIGQVLMDKAIALAQAGSYEFIWLGVWEHNAKGIRFYEKNGFVAFDEHIFLMVDDPQRDLLMKRVLDKNS